MQAGIGHADQLVGQLDTAGLVLAQMLVDDDATNVEGVIEGALEVDVEPAVDGGVDEAQGKSVDDDHRRHGEQDQGQQQAPAQAGARRIAGKVAAQAPEPLADQDEQHEKGQHGRAEHPAIGVDESATAAGRLLGQLQRCGQQGEHRRRRQQAPSEQGQPAVTVHAYSGACRRQAGSSMAGRRRAPGNAP